jgi:hypothetical protein
MRGGSNWVGWTILIVLAVVAVGFSIRESGLREGKTGSYQGRMVSDGQIAPAAQREIQSRIGNQGY